MESKPLGRPLARAPLRGPDLFTASDVARFCQVDLKTIHNWADKAELPCSRTRGRHLRFRRLDVIDFLRKYGYAIPDALRQGRPRVAVVDDDTAALSVIKRALGKRFELASFQDPLDALVALATAPPDGLVLEVGHAEVDGVRFIARLRALEVTRHIRVIVFTRRDELRQRALDAGAIVVIAKDDVSGLRDAMESAMGLDRATRQGSHGGAPASSSPAG